MLFRSRKIAALSSACGGPWRPKCSTDADPELGSWVRRQRVAKRNGALPQGRTGSLGAIGFGWGAKHLDAWGEKFEKLAARAAASSGSTRAPAKYKAGPMPEASQKALSQPAPGASSRSRASPAKDVDTSARIQSSPATVAIIAASSSCSSQT